MILEYNLQFFAKDGPGGEKTEPATPKKLEDARKDGKVAKSKEMNNAITLLGLFVVLRVFLGNMGSQFLNLFEIIYNQLSDFSIQNGFDRHTANAASVSGSQFSDRLCSRSGAGKVASHGKTVAA